MPYLPKVFLGLFPSCHVPSSPLSERVVRAVRDYHAVLEVYSPCQAVLIEVPCGFHVLEGGLRVAARKTSRAYLITQFLYFTSFPALSVALHLPPQ